MKKIIPILIILLLIGCKPKQIIQERTVYKVDSTAVTSLKSELQKKTIELQVATTDLERTREQNIKLQSDVSQHEINYDTNAQVDPQTGYYPDGSISPQSGEHSGAWGAFSQTLEIYLLSPCIRHRG